MNLERIRIKLIKKPFQNTNHYVLFTRPGTPQLPGTPPLPGTPLLPGTPQITSWEDEVGKTDTASGILHSREEIEEYILRSQSQENSENPEDPDQTNQVLVYPLTNPEDGKF